MVLLFRIVTPLLRAHIRRLPARPGVYLFKDARGSVLYVGKARNLKARVSQYLAPTRLDPMKCELMQRAAAVETIVTRNEREALTLEATLIREQTPPYNVRLLDDSSFLYVRITRDTIPAVSLTRRLAPDGSWYRGPYPVASAIRRTLREARKLFPWCEFGRRTPVAGRRIPDAGRQLPDARYRKLETELKPCFAYHLGLCPGICVQRVSVEEYHRIIEGLKKFLDGDTLEVLHALRARMEEASARQAYERASHFRDTIAAIKKSTLPQVVATARRESVDALGLARRGTHAIITVLSVRHGRVVGSRPFSLIGPHDESNAAVLRSFLVSYLSRAADDARELLLPEAIEDVDLLECMEMRGDARTQGDARRRGDDCGTSTQLHASPRISVPQRGWKRRLLDLARTNAEEALKLAAAELTSPAELQRALQELARALQLLKPPRRIEAYDISNIQGSLATGSLVVFVDGLPKRSAYRRFKIMTVSGSDDVGMMREVLRRRFGKHARAARAFQLPKLNRETSEVGKEWPLPDLVLLDGGKGQLNAGRTVLGELGLALPLASLAKREEEFFVPARAEALHLPPTSPALFLLQRIRDEAHRFTLGYHQLLRQKRMTKSILEEIPGVGDATRKKLLRHFGSLRAIRAASQEDLARVVGAKAATTIRQFLC